MSPETAARGRDDAKREALGRLFERLRASLERTGSLPPIAHAAASSSAPAPDQAAAAPGAAQPAEAAAGRAAECGAGGGGAATEAAAAPPAEAAGEGREGDGSGPMVWTLLYLAQHYDRLGRTGAVCWLT